MSDRKEVTTNFIRDAALSELVRSGHSALTMESVARASYSSVGSVYARFAGRSELFADLLSHRISPALQRLSEGSGSLDSRLAAALADDGIGAIVRALTELSLAARHDENILPIARDLVSDLVGMIAEDEHPGIRWLVAAVVLGRQFLVGVGCDIPRISEDLAVFVREMSRTINQPTSPTVRRDAPPAPVPNSPAPKSTDSLADALAEETIKALARNGLSGANLKDIAAGSGVTTGAVYRRYNSKNDLVRDTVMRQLGPRRYEWTGRFVAACVGQSDDSPGDILADQVLELLGDEQRAFGTLELLHAARVDTAVRETLSSQFHAAAAARTAMFAQLVNAGIVSPQTSPLLMGWLIQTAPTGGRILLALDLMSDEDDLRRGLRSVVSAVLTG